MLLWVGGVCRVVGGLLLKKGDGERCQEEEMGN